VGSVCARATTAALAVLAGCTVDTLSPAGRPCSASAPCGPGAFCDPARGRCVASGAAGDRAKLAADGARDRAPAVPDRAAGEPITAPCAGKPEGAGCDDSLYCAVNEVCKGGACVGEPRSCAVGPTPSPCTANVCDEKQRKCVTAPRADGTPCPAGACYGGTCCAGCWSGSLCVAGKEITACGHDGYLCANCTLHDCRAVGSWLCSSKGCVSAFPKPDGTACSGGVCRDGDCCTGCWDGSGCRPGRAENYCGSQGAACADCGSECRVGPGCSKQSCQAAKPDGTSCAGGKCVAGTCCKGCVESATCWGGSPAHCGLGGAACLSCPAPPTQCKSAACEQGSCSVVNATDGSSCKGGSCRGGACCTGCWDGSSCRSGNDLHFCGKGGSACTNCAMNNLTCKEGSCA
jgi:hypothetical protein